MNPPAIIAIVLLATFAIVLAWSRVEAWAFHRELAAREKERDIWRPALIKACQERDDWFNACQRYIDALHASERKRLGLHPQPKDTP